MLDFGIIDDILAPRMPYDFRKCLQDDLDVRPQIPAIVISVVEPRSIIDRSIAPESVDLRPTSEANWGAMPVGVVRKSI